MGVSPSLNPTGVGIRLPNATSNSLNSQVENPEPGSRLQKLEKVARDFEGVLLSSWLEEVQKSSLDPSGPGQAAGSETLRSLGTQAVAQAIAQRGGLGIARMIVHHFRNVVDR